MMGRCEGDGAAPSNGYAHFNPEQEEMKGSYPGVTKTQLDERAEKLPKHAVKKDTAKKAKRAE
eukprot:1729082-Alexandrium_andersonii.AAC.1